MAGAAVLTDNEIIQSLQDAFNSGCEYLKIFSRRQDIGIQKCERGVQLGILRFVEVEIDDQETHWHYYWTHKAAEILREKAAELKLVTVNTDSQLPVKRRVELD